jgi:hypothetical protein
MPRRPPKFAAAGGLRIELDLEGAEETIGDLDWAVRALHNAAPAWRAVSELLEKGEQRHFGKLASQTPDYVRTGKLRASLTGVSPDSIRRVHGHGLDFGTSLFYARFQVKKTRDPETGQLRAKAGRKWSGKSAVLVVDKPTREAVSQVLLDYVVRKRGGRGGGMRVLRGLHG